MIKIYSNTEFLWNNISSTTLGLKLVKVNIENTKEVFSSPRNINSTKVKIDKYHDNNYVHSIKREPLSFTLELASESRLTPERCEELARVFVTDNFVNFINYDNNHCYNCYCTTTDLDVFVNGFFITLQCVCSSSYSTSFWMTDTYDITETRDIVVNNKGSIPTFLIAEIIPKVTGSTIRLTNKTNAGIFFEIGTNNNTQLIKDERIKIDFKKNKIRTDQLGIYRYDNVSNNSDWLFPIVTGNNILEVNPCFLQLKYRYYYLT